MLFFIYKIFLKCIIWLTSIVYLRIAAYFSYLQICSESIFYYYWKKKSILYNVSSISSTFVHLLYIFFLISSSPKLSYFHWLLLLLFLFFCFNNTLLRVGPAIWTNHALARNFIGRFTVKGVKNNKKKKFGQEFPSVLVRKLNLKPWINSFAEMKTRRIKFLNTVPMFE